MYYYTAAALPMLTLDSTPPISSDALLEFCKETLHPSDASTVECILSSNLSDRYGDSYAERWREFEIDLRNALVDLRAQKLGWGGGESRRNDASSHLANTIAQSAFSSESPMDVEIALDDARWKFAAEMEQGHYFDMIFIISYCLKLTILERRAKLTFERGREAYEKIYETTLESLNVGDADGE